MSKKHFSEKEIQKLSKNPYVKTVFDNPNLPKVDGIACPKFDKYNDLILSNFVERKRRLP